MKTALERYAPLAGRILLSQIFLLSGLMKVFGRCRPRSRLKGWFRNMPKRIPAQCP